MQGSAVFEVTSVFNSAGHHSRDICLWKQEVDLVIFSFCSIYRERKAGRLFDALCIEVYSSLLVFMGSRKGQKSQEAVRDLGQTCLAR